MNQSQENCLADSHRLTHEVWGGDYSCVFIARNLLLFGTGFWQGIAIANAFPKIEGMHFF